MSRFTMAFAAGWLLLAAAGWGQAAEPQQKYGDWSFPAGKGYYYSQYEAAGPQEARSLPVKHYCIVHEEDPTFAYFVIPLTNKCWCRYDFENAAFEVVPAAEQRKLNEMQASAFQRVQQAPLVPGSDQVTLAAPKNPLRKAATP